MDEHAGFQLPLQHEYQRLGQWDDALFPSFPVMHSQNFHFEVQILHTLRQAQAGELGEHPRISGCPSIRSLSATSS